jgi:uroporphyrinogen-III synthase
LNGRVLAFVESRMPDQMASLVRRHGGVPFSAPVLEEIYLKDSPQVQQLVADVCSGRVDVVVLLTGVGTRALIETAASMGRQQEFIDSLDRVKVIARSPKPASVLRRHKIHIDVMPPEPYTSEDLVQAMTGLDLPGREVAVQKYGGPNSFLLQSLRERGAKVREVTLYTWGLPADRTPALGLIDALVRGKIDSLAFTSQPQVGNLLTIARDAGKEQSLREGLDGSLVVASVGPVCSRRLRDAGIKIDVEPEHPHMGNLVLAVAEHFERRLAIS